MAAGILIIEDELTLAKNIATYLGRAGYDACVASSGEDGLARLETFRPEVVLLDYALPGISGLDVLHRIKALDSGIPVILMTGNGSELVAVAAMKAGAHDYLIKPVVLSELKLRLEKLLGDTKRDEELTYHRSKVAADGGLEKLIGDSAPMQALKGAIRQLLVADASLADEELPAVLITGETGTGKELVARALHFGGPRRDAPFVELNCSTIPGDLLEAELFGYERGAFTDAKQKKLGLIETATGGTLFLDEIGDLDPRVQVKLLKLLEDKIVRRLGSVREQRANIRIVAATNRDLEQAVRDGGFRADLLFRLRIVHFELPPLRARGDDALALAAHYLDLQRRRYRKPQLRLTAEAKQAMLRYRWPGNVRELRNLIEQAVIMTTGDSIGAAELRLTSTIGATLPQVDSPATTSSTDRQAAASGLNLAEVERELLVRALAQAEGNVTQAARLLGVSRDTVRYRVEKHGLNPVE
ncbi:MAG: sigma-54 dependent transcriptional regulator [Betaproteobacteria bacterium]